MAGCALKSEGVNRLCIDFSVHNRHHRWWYILWAVLELPSHSPLPHVEEADILSLVFSEILDPAYRQHWDELAAENPELARAILGRAVIESDGRPDEQQRLVNMAIFASEAIAAAISRTRATSDTSKISNGDGEGLPL